MKLSTIITIAIMVLLITGCTSAPAGEVVKEKQEVIKIGAILSLTGPAAVWGESGRQGIELAVSDVNAKGGINGKKLVVVYEDDGTDSKQAVTAFHKLVSTDKVSAIIGGTWDFNYNAIAPLAETYKITLFTPQNLKAEGLVINDYTFVMRPDLRKLTWVLEDEIKNNNIKRAAIIRYVSSFGQALSYGMQDIMQKTGGELVLDEQYNTIGSNDFLTMVTKVKNSKAEALFIDMMDTDIVNLIKRTREQGLDIKIFSHSTVEDGLVNPDVDNSLYNGIVYFDWDTPPSEEFRTKFREKYEVEPSRSTDGAYDSVMIIAEAFSEISDKARINEYIQTHSFKTINGEITFKDNVVNTRIVFVKKVVNGKVEIISKKEIIT
ncbi:ABC transporter substrate-binding protein [Candidatus Woesearchaeota archaeon]|nr:ABC transporter substrate-binding protein [Candidatus Woesearchaeota archaeon]